jgi:outer membrane receptor protein involved in Fe transport
MKDIIKTNLIKTSLYLIMFLSAFILNGQNKPTDKTPGSGPPAIGVIKGEIEDSLSGDPVEYASIALFKIKDSSLITGTITNEKGQFQLTKVPMGKYYMVVSFIGYDNHKIRNIFIKPPEVEIDMGIIKLSPSTNNLSAVNITGEKKLMEFKLDKKVVNVDKILTSTGGTAIDVLQNVPSVTVDYDGSVSLRGNSNITILIDGRPSSVTGTKLEQIPASSIESIELITNPSAKYNPEGMSGIINIRLKKKKAFGLNGLVSANVGTGDKYNGSINLNYNFNRVNLFGSYDTRYNRREGWGDMYQSSTINDTTFLLSQNSESQRKGNSNNFKLGADFFLNPKNTITLTWLYNKGKGKDFENTISNNYDFNQLLRDYYTANSSENENDNNIDYTLNYKKTFDKKGKELTADIIVNTGSNAEKNDFSNYYYIENYIPFESAYTELQKQNTDGNFYNATLQTNYIHPFGKETKLETGFQGVFRNNDDDYTLDRFDNGLSQWYSDTTQSNHFVYTEQIYAVYGIFSKEYKKWSFQVGTRLEQAFTKAEQKTVLETNNKQYFSVFPTFHTTYKLTDNQDFQLSYSRRINRPDMHSLNPFVDYSNPNIIRYGNPNLKPEYINSYEIGHSIFWKKTSISSSLFYRQINDVIKRYGFVDSNRITHMTSANLSSGKSYGIELVAEHSIFKWWRMNANFSYFRTIIEGDKENTSLTNDNYSWTSKLNSNMMLPKGIMFQISGFYRGPMVTPQGEMAAMYSADIALKKDFLKDNKLSVSFRLSDVFNTQQFKMTASDVNFSAEHTRKRESRVAYIGISYKINQGLKSKTKKRPSDNNIDDDGGEF